MTNGSQRVELPLWIPEMLDLVAWFEHERPRLLLELRSSPRLSRAVIVSDPNRFLETLAVDIAAGPSGPRVRLAVLQQDLRRLREIFDRRTSKVGRKPAQRNLAVSLEAASR
jgi:hypothetical protein